MEYGEFDSIDDFIAALEKDAAILDEILLSFEAEQRDLEEIDAEERRLMLALEDGSPESLQEVFDFMRELGEALE